ncbi:DUF4192 domain-containing protein [Saccharothrix sp.]|uniref:DUF4192 domain-containing protein n=1 Tax=Saccharothrix sp. TaxID=1873460 RepID=UPI00281259EB|nr:DUF4192 domain-containing protein [Saccharothrix sp.]
MLEATDLKEFLFAVSDLLSVWGEGEPTTAHMPVDGWPWPWEDDRHADWIYTFDGRRVWATHRSTTRTTTTAALIPDPDDILLDRAAVMLSLASHFDDTKAAGPTEPDRPTVHRSRYDMVHTHVEQAATRTTRLSDFEVAELTLALSDNMVHDCCLSFAVGEHADAAEKLWIELVAASPSPARANPAALLAMSAFIRGDHRLTDAALAHLDDTAPGHPVANLLRPGRPLVSQEELRRTAEGSRQLIECL